MRSSVPSQVSSCAITRKQPEIAGQGASLGTLSRHHRASNLATDGPRDMTWIPSRGHPVLVSCKGNFRKSPKNPPRSLVVRTTRVSHGGEGSDHDTLSAITNRELYRTCGHEGRIRCPCCRAQACCLTGHLTQ